MNATAIKTVLRYGAGWGGVILFASLLTLIFSFLGAFFCAALAGMMLGSFKIRRWQTVALSLTFPAVLLVILRTGGAELLIGQVFVLSAICFGTFWLTYGVVRVVVCYERKGQIAARKSDLAASPQRLPSLEAPPKPPLVAVPINGSVAKGLSLGNLQGKWSCIAGKPDCEHKFLEIEHENLLLTINDSTGQTRFLGRGVLEVNHDKVPPLLSVTAMVAELDDSLISI